MTMEHYYGVIMAGGGGTRLWPLSRRHRPKQTLAILGDKSLFQTAVDRILPLIPPERVRVVTIEEQLPLLRKQRPELPQRSFVLEPAPKGTASVVGLAAVLLQAEDPEAVMAVLTADHAIANTQRFRDLLAAAYSAAQSGYLVTLGVEPTEAATGYGYLERGEKLEEIGGFNLYQVDSFREKPDEDTAVDYLESGRYAWNSGMFVWRVERILSEIEMHMPSLMKGLDRIRPVLGSIEAEVVIRDVWQGLESETIDYGIMEQANQVVMLPAEDLGWRDVGSWDSLYEVLEADPDGNIVLSDDVMMIESKGNVVIQESDQARLIAALGVDDLVIVDTGSALLITTRERAQEVRDVVARLRSKGREAYL